MWECLHVTLYHFLSVAISLWEQPRCSFSTSHHKEKITTCTESSTCSLKMNIQELSFFCFTLKTTEVLPSAGEVAILPCKRSTCSGVGWLYTRDAIRIATENSSMGDAHVDLKCSLDCFPGRRCRWRAGGLRWLDEQGKSPQRGNNDMDKSSTCSLKMTTQELILIFLLHFEVVSGESAEVFARAGDVAILPCKNSACDRIDWLYSRDQSGLVREVRDGQVVTSSARSQRLNLTEDCSLLIHKVVAEDGGFFVCKSDGQKERILVLMVMTLTPSSSPMGDHHVVLECSLTCWPDKACRCLEGGLRWLDEQGKALSPLRTEQTNCVSFLKVIPVSYEKKYTCQYVKSGDVEVQAQYTAALTKGNTRGPESPGAPPPDRNFFIIIGAAGGGILILIIVVVAIILVKIKSRKNAGHDDSKHEENNVTYASVSYDHNTEITKHQDGSPEETESGVTYATVNLKKKKKKEEENGKKQVAEEGEEVVTYAAVRTPARIPPQQDGSQ
ncbi:uncharacterized protein LOC109516713 isoform X2 [Hippocampus comes]|uniref:uncharacterized protein LOC109516713 isoform X2 n=1 Tax=Hippocampus comes TaxID=109280 RepID=UPI00094F3690|nr:PREDICTED: uncharacterized protein LOC109516713 isoform X2 [Hippocampus comes]